MKKALFFSIMIASFIGPGCSNAQSRLSKKILIVYLSRTNNTKAIAEIIQKNVGGTLVALELVTPYPTDYHATVQQVVKENETGYLPPFCETSVYMNFKTGLSFSRPGTYWRPGNGEPPKNHNR
jgi:hypothetical protein